jgi:hypothetical protein
MRTPYHGEMGPFELRSNVIMFHDWRYVTHGPARWETPDGRWLGLWGGGDVPPMHYAGRDNPHGICLRALPATKSAPFLSPNKQWEGMLFAPTVIREDGRYRLWYEAMAPADMVKGDDEHRNLLCYAESDDGVMWRRITTPHDIPGWGAVTNAVYGGPMAPAWAYHGGSVFRDDSCDAAERYKCIHLGTMTPEGIEAFLRKYPGECDPHNLRSRQKFAVCGAVSPDGLTWTPLDEPLNLQVSDTQNIAYYDAFLKKYVAYLRTWIMGRRAIGRAESDNFRHFPLPATILWPGCSAGPTDTWYANAKTVYPGTEDYHLMFPKRWRIAEDRFFCHVATSPDGILWEMPPDSQVLSPGDGREWDAGGVSIGCGLVDLPGDRVGVPFIGFCVPHKYPRRPPLGELAWAMWQRGRLIALEASDRGEFRTMPVVFDGDELRINVRTRHCGHVRVEVVGAGSKALAGRSFDDCDPIEGDHLDARATWLGQSSLPRAAGEALSFRVRIVAGELFEMRFRNSV